jgi:hypothetical protein
MRRTRSQWSVALSSEQRDDGRWSCVAWGGQINQGIKQAGGVHAMTFDGG